MMIICESNEISTRTGHEKCHDLSDDDELFLKRKRIRLVRADLTRFMPYHKAGDAGELGRSEPDSSE